MKAKSLSTKERRKLISATNISPADYPIGSPESRAIARSILAQLSRPAELTPDEWDYLRLYRGDCLLNARMTPDYRYLESTAVYARGREISERLGGPESPSHLAPHCKQASRPSEDVQRTAVMHRLGYSLFIDAWKRQLPEMPCPLRLDSERLFRRVSHGHVSCPTRPRTPADAGFDWEEVPDVQPNENWRSVELKAFEDHANEHGIRQLSTFAPHPDSPPN